jgi:hypothetical protein
MEASMSTFFEALENRQLLSVVPSTGAPVLTSASTSTVATTVVLSGRTIHAEVGEKFTAVLGTISNLPAVQKPYSLHGTITWGDASNVQVVSPATFVHMGNGSIGVVGSHTYLKVATDKITITITEVPPPGTAIPVKLIGTIHSVADVIAKTGVTLQETTGVKFTADLGLFSSKLSASVLTATINWGDGTTSIGKILATPVASPIAGGKFAVFGTHTYASAKSYLVHVTITTSPVVTPGGVSTPIILVVAQWDSVIDVLPPVPSATA